MLQGQAEDQELGQNDREDERKFIPRDYQIILFRRMQNLRQKLMTVKEYTEEFYRLNIRVGHRESDDEKVARYLNGLRYDIQDELSMVTIRTMEDAYQMALKDEEKLSHKQVKGSRQKSAQGKSVAQDKYQKPKEEWKKPQGKVERGGTSQRGPYVEQRGKHTEQREIMLTQIPFLVLEVEEEEEVE
jgi:hypothetical protein